jgi:hypothetical protein
LLRGFVLEREGEDCGAGFDGVGAVGGGGEGAGNFVEGGGGGEGIWGVLVGAWMGEGWIRVVADVDAVRASRALRERRRLATSISYGHELGRKVSLPDLRDIVDVMWLYAEAVLSQTGCAEAIDKVERERGLPR